MDILWHSSVVLDVGVNWTNELIMCNVVLKLSVCCFYSDFDVHLYLCNAAFSYLDFATFVRLTRRLVFPVYAVAHCGLLIMLTKRVLGFSVR